MPKFSVLVANYNNSEYLEDCLTSIVSQDFFDFEVIVVDDASIDNSIDLIRDLMLKDERIKLFQNAENRGAGFTKKRCIDESNGEICGFVDPDDVLAKDALSIMYEEHQLYPDSSAVYSTHYMCDENLNIVKIEDAIRQQPKGVPVYKDTFVSHFFTFKRMLYLKTVGMNPNYQRAVDRDLYTLMDEVGELIFIDKVLYYYRRNKNSISLNDNLYKSQYWDLIVKHNAAMRRGENLENEYARSIFLYNSLLERMTLKEVVYLLLTKLGLIKK